MAEKLKVALQDQQQGLPVANEQMTVAQFFDCCLADVVKPSVRPKTYATYAQIVRLHLASEHAQSIMNDKLRAELSPRTVQEIRAVLRQALNQARWWGAVARNV